MKNKKCIFRCSFFTFDYLRFQGISNTFVLCFASHCTAHRSDGGGNGGRTTEKKAAFAAFLFIVVLIPGLLHFVHNDDTILINSKLTINHYLINH